MSIKAASFDYINQETKEFLDLEFNFDKGNFGGLATAKENTKVELIYKPNWEEWINAMYYTAFTTWNNEHEINLEKNKEKSNSLTIEFLKKRPISAVLESAIFVLKIDNIPRSMTHQIVRHRGMSFNQESYRVTPAHHADFRIPDGLTHEQKEKILENVNANRKTYVDLIESGIPIEQARNILGMGTCTHIVMTTNLKVLKDYLNARTLDITQDEHTYIVALILKELKEKAPMFYDNLIKNENLEKIIKTYLQEGAGDE